jgi:hypothetical protein
MNQAGATRGTAMTAESPDLAATKRRWISPSAGEFCFQRMAQGAAHHPPPPQVPSNHPRTETVLMSRCKLTVQGRGPDGRVIFSVEEYQGKVWITSYYFPFTCGAILDPARLTA